jgi:hypothetical protein
VSEVSPFFQFEAHSVAFLERSRNHLEHFDSTGDVESFFHAALHLRFGIEARVTEYLKAALERRGEKIENVPDYVASKLLKRLEKEDSTAGTEGLLRITDEQKGRSSTMAYTPVTKELASLHGRLGGLLHYQFFVENKFWYLREKLDDKKTASIADFRELLEDGIRGLEYSTSGTLLGNPRFSELVEEVLVGGAG